MRIMNERRLSDNKTACIKNLKEITRNGYDFVDTLGTKDFFSNRRIVPVVSTTVKVINDITLGSV